VTPVRLYRQPGVGDVVLFGVYAGTDEHGVDVVQQYPAIVVVPSPGYYPLDGYELMVSELALLSAGKVEAYYRVQFSESPRINYWSYRPGDGIP
jgi:hypothetical protein